MSRAACGRETSSPSRFDAAKAAAKEFINKQPHTVKVGIVAFAAAAALVQPPTTSRDDLFAALDRLRLQRGTAVGSGILVSLDAIFENDPKAQDQPQDGFGFGGGGFGGGGGAGGGLGQFGAQQQDPNQPLTNQQSQPDQPPVAPGSYTSAAIVLLTDGQTNTGPDPLDAADAAANKGVRVFTVGVGTTGETRSAWRVDDSGWAWTKRA